MLLEPEKRLPRRAWVEVDLSAIRDNITAVRAHAGEAGILAVVKADAYGHGMIPVAFTALEAGARWLGVATVEEGVALRESGIYANIALLCPIAPDEAEDVLIHNLVPTVGDLGTLDVLIVAAKRTGKQGVVHLEIDTGIGRSGVLPNDAIALWRYATENELRVTGICTHFADSDGANIEQFTQPQMTLFERTRKAIENRGARFLWIHESGSAAVLRVPGANGNLVRPGLLIYGLRPAVPMSEQKTLSLRPVLTLKTHIATVRELPAGHNISYGLTCALERNSRVATILIGYGDGYPRRLSNRGHVLVRGKLAPILGRVCMDQTVVDVTDIPEASAGDIAVCIGTQGSASLSAESLAACIGTTEHEITTCLTPRLPRIYRE